MKIFENLKVVELASVLAGPAVGMFFSELGAQVIKIENKKTKGDITRQWKTKSEDPNENISAYFSSINYGKKYLFLDLNEKSDHEQVLKLIGEADVLITNFKSGDDIRYQLDYETLKKINSQLIYASISGFGAHDKRIAYDVVLQAESGFMSINGTPESGPVKMPVALIDVLAAHQLKEAVLIALLKRNENKKGYLVSVSLYDTAISSLVNQASNFLMTGVVPQRMGSLHPNIAPYGETFITSDKKFVVLAIGSDEQFRKFAELIGDPMLAKNQKFMHNSSRVKNRKELYNELQNLIYNYRRDEFIQEMIENQIPVGAVKNIDEVFESEEAQQSVLTEKIEGQETKRVKSVAFTISD